MTDHDALRDHLLYLLRGGGAHPPIDSVLADCWMLLDES